jgi:hypothetical protein
MIAAAREKHAGIADHAAAASYAPSRHVATAARTAAKGDGTVGEPHATITSGVTTPFVECPHHLVHAVIARIDGMRPSSGEVRDRVNGCDGIGFLPFTL